MNLKTLKAMALTGEFNFESNSAENEIQTAAVLEQPQTVYNTGMNATR